MFKINRVVSLVALMAVSSSVSYAQSVEAVRGDIDNIVAVSEKLVSDSDRAEALNKEDIISSLYKQIRPNIKLSGDGFTDEEIEVKTKSYIEMAYYPALTGNYIGLYDAMKDDGVSLTVCEERHPQSFTFGDLRAVLCFDNSKDSDVLVVRYSAYQDVTKSFKPTVQFLFSPDQMIGIDMMKTGDAKYHIQGL